MGGISGAVLILPFQVSFLGFTGPAVSSTNLLFNVLAIPSGVYRYARVKRIVWPLAWLIVATTIPGVVVGAYLRIKFLPDARSFKLFVGCVLAYTAARLLLDLLKKNAPASAGETRFEATDIRSGFSSIDYRFNDVSYSISVWKIALLSSVVGLVGGVYGIGGGALIAPFLVAMFALPVHSIAGVTLFGTFVSSIAGVAAYAGISAALGGSGATLATPDWLLGASFGVGGAAGMYIGARFQRFVPARVIKGILAALTLFTAAKYIWDYFA